jgi:hypothetical protein
MSLNIKRQGTIDFGKGGVRILKLEVESQGITYV